MHSGGGDTPRRVPGFPIRKPPDHSLAAGSPGHIAGSSVLHRLLVPRHPPCALKNLAQQNMHYKQQLRRTPPPRGRIQDRCSRPLCSSQETPRASPRPPARGNQDRPAREKPPPPDGGAGSLRTQQRAQPHPPPGARVPRPDQLGRTTRTRTARPAE
jgi:hypothetical protein